MAVVARCPHCRGRFPWKPDMPLPTRCPLPGCDYVASREYDDTVIHMPSLRGQATKNNDQLYRDIEKSSEVRAQMAADAAGVPVSEMASLKVTNMRDNVREGESYAMPVRNEVTRQMDLMKAKGGVAGFGATSGAEWAKQAQSQAPRAGISALEAVNRNILKRPG